MNASCTIVTADYIHYALALNESLLKFQIIPLYILLVDDKIDERPIQEKFPNVHFLYLSDIEKQKNAKEIIAKYKGIDDNALRWSLKSILANYLLEKYNKLLVLDADLFFYQNFQFLFDELDENNILLTPHWRNSLPFAKEGKENEHFEHLFVAGLFNAGFIGLNRESREALDWWASCCLYRCDLTTWQGHFGDQTYLNLMPIYFEKVKIMKHRGCNLSEWNYVECKRTLQKDGSVLINDKYPIVFIHFAGCFVDDIEAGKDKLLEPHLKNWKQVIATYKPHSIQKENTEEEIEEKPTILEDDKISFLVNLKRTLRIRTRIRRFIAG